MGTFPTGFVEDVKATPLMRYLVETAVLRLRTHVNALGELDPVTQDLVIEVLRGLEKHQWMLRAQAA